MTGPTCCVSTSHTSTVSIAMTAEDQRSLRDFSVTHWFNHSRIHSNQIGIKHLICTRHYARLWTPSIHRSAKFYNLFSLFEVPSRTQLLSGGTVLVSIGNCSVSQQAK